MRTFSLQLKPKTDPPPDTASAWFIPGADGHAWLREAISCSAPESALSLYVIPRSPHDLSPSGVLLRASMPFAPGGTCAAIPCDTIGGGKLFLPSIATLHPPVTAAELERALPTEHYFLHPSLGLTAFDGDSALRVLDLLEPPTARAADWSYAHPGNPPVPRLTSVELTLSESIEDLLDPGRDEIGTKTKDQLPPHPDEKSAKKPGKGVGGIAAAGAGLAGAAGALAAGGILKGIQKLAKNAPQTGSGTTGPSSPSWVDRLQDWASKRMESIDMMPQQDKEIERLLHLLETNPDEGLKYALPLNADNARGAGDLSSHLTRNNTDFSLRNLGGGGAYSPWNLGWEAEQRLTQKYREAANRELRLGRHRRAAYIFAELLNDRSAAADALKQGKHFREAGILYRDHIHQPLEAATCFRQAGMISDAIVIYEEQKKFETLGDLYRELDREEEAVTAYRSEVARLVDEKRQPIPAARLLEKKLGAPQEALELVHDGWTTALPNDQPRCLRVEFELLERLARPDAASARVTEVCADPNFTKVIPLVDFLSELSTSYFNPPTRELATDAARVVTGNHLKKFSTTDQRRLLELIQRTEQQDLLLQRDSRRFTELSKSRWSPAKTPAKRKPPHRPNTISGNVTLVDSYKLWDDAEWEVAIASSDGFHVGGFGNNRLVLRSLKWQPREVAKAVWKIPPATTGSIELVAENRRGSQVHIFNGSRFLSQATYNIGGSTSTSLIEKALGFAPGSQDWSIEPAQGDIAIYGRDPYTRAVLSTHSLSVLPAGIDRAQLLREIGFVPMLEQKEQLIFAFGQHVGRLFRGEISWIQLDQPVVKLHPSPSHTKLRIVATHAVGASMMWADSDWGGIETFAGDFDFPVASFTRSGKIVVASLGQVRTYIVVGHDVIAQETVPFEEPVPPIAVIDQDLRNFHILTRTTRHHFSFEKT